MMNFDALKRQTRVVAQYMGFDITEYATKYGLDLDHLATWQNMLNLLLNRANQMEEKEHV